MTRLAILLSGRGSNFLAMAEAIRSGTLPHAEIALVLSNIPDAPGLAAARSHGLPTLAIPSKGRTRPEHEYAVIDALQAHRIELVCLAGYMRIVSPVLVAAFPNRLLNNHPSLLPAFPGLDAQRQALEYGAKITGCTVHFVDEQVDHGVIVLQRPVPIEDTDTPNTLSARILLEEHRAYPEAIARVLSGDFSIQERRFLPKRNPSSSDNVAATHAPSPVQP